MSFAIRLALAVSVAIASVPAGAGPRHHRHHHAAPDYPYAEPYAGGWQAEALARAAQEMQDAPGVTNELAPDAKATATGGPSGGVPGFSGGR